MADELPKWLDAEDWEDFKEHRRLIKKPMTAIAEKRMLRKLARMHESGEPVSQCLERSMVNGWQDVYQTPAELKESRAQAHKDFEKQPEPESKISEEEAASNVRRLHDMIDGTMKIQGGGR